MKIKQVQIKNYKSIKDVTIPFEEYGDDPNKDKAVFLLGLNETGKTSILEALSFIDKDFSGINYEDTCFKSNLDTNEYVELLIDLELNDIKFWIEQISKQCSIPVEIAEQIKFTSLQKHIYLTHK